jgi:serine/threonine protein phosphatase PrpC
VLAQWTPVPPAVDTFVEVLRDATVDANQRLHRYAVAHPEHRGMGTTLTAAGVLDDQLYLVQVGDSRGYLVRDGVARQLTKDQSLIQRLVELGELTAEQAEASTRRNIILQALGPEAQVVVDLTHQPLRDGDLLLLCSDGLSGLVSPDELAALAAAHEDEAALCEALVAQANARGGHDNITVVVARFHGEGLGPAQLRADPTPRFGTPVPSPEVIAQARAAQAAVREAPTVAGGVAAIREPVATVAAETARLEERRARALPIQVALGLLGAAALLWALANLLQR